MIRKIVIGVNPLKAMAYYVGQRAGESTIDTIIVDDKYSHLYNKVRYLIYISHPNDGIMLWKSVTDMPVIIEYDCDFK